MNFPTPKDAWLYALHQISEYGTNLVTEDNQLIREVLNLSLTIKSPLSGYPIEGSGWDLPALQTYADQLCTFSYDKMGFDYTYSERLGRQIHYIINKLKENPTTRRATAYLWLPERDLELGLHVPCQIVADYKIRSGKLYACHFFRSHDIKCAWPSNVYGLAKLQEMIAREVGVQTGPLTTVSVSAHYYID